MMQKIGFVIMAIGAAAADSEKLWIPALIVAIGLALMYVGSEVE